LGLVAAFGLLNVTEPNRYGEYETDVRLFETEVRATVQIAHVDNGSEIIVRFAKPFPEECLSMAAQQMGACAREWEMV